MDSVAATAARQVAAATGRAVAAVRPRTRPDGLPDRVGRQTDSKPSRSRFPDRFSDISSLSDSDRE